MQREGGTMAVAGQGADSTCVTLDAGALHDLLSPVNQMCTMADLMLIRYRGSLDSEAEDLFGFIQGAAVRMRNLMGGLRTYTQTVGSRSHFRPCDGNSLVAAALVIAGAAIEQSGAVVTHDALPKLYCEPAQMGYIFGSLIDNAIKFRGESRPEIHISATVEQDRVVFAFRDNGIGIDPRHRESIFGVFKRVHNDAYPGAGVGLAIAKKIIEGHGGRIWVESALGEGATFILALPKSNDGGIRS